MAFGPKNLSQPDTHLPWNSTVANNNIGCGEVAYECARNPSCPELCYEAISRG